MNLNIDRPCPSRWRRLEIYLLLLACSIVLASRLPWITAGPGTDPDSFRVINAATHLAETGEYSYSRPPGYPLHEYLAAELVHLGAAGTNLLSAYFSVAASVFLALILRRSGVRPYLLATLGFAFTPVVYINSTSTIDYVPAIALVLAATYLVLSGRPIVAGMSLGLASGFRLTSGAMLIPLVLWIALDARGGIAVRRNIQFVTTTLAIAIICFAPVLLEYGFGFFTFADNVMYPPLGGLLYDSAISVWGSVGGIALVGLCSFMPLYYRGIKARLAVRQTRASLLLAAVAVVIYVAAFLRLPHEAGYLVPIVPFTIIIFALILPATPIRTLGLALILSSFATIGRSGITLHGPVLQDHTNRIAAQERTQAIVAAVERLPEDAIVVVGWNLPSIRSQLQSAGHEVNQYVYLIPNEASCVEYRAEGRQVYFLPGIDLYNKRVHGVDLAHCGAQRSNVLEEE